MSINFPFFGRSYLAIDIGKSALKVVEVNAAANKILSYFVADIPPKTWQNPLPYSEIASLLKTTLERQNITSRRAVLTLDGSEAFVNSFNVPNLSGNELVGAIQWMVKKLLPYPVEESAIDYCRLGGENAAGNELLAAAARRDYLAKLTDLARQAGLELLGATVQPLALAQLLSQDQLKENASLAILDIGHAFSQIILIHQGQVRSSRTVAFAGRSFATAIATSFTTATGQVSLNLNEADKILEQADLIGGTTANIKGAIPVSQVYSYLRPELEKLADEVNRSFDYSESQLKLARPAKIWLTGGGSLLKNLDHFLSQSLGLPIQRLEPLSIFGPSDRVDIKKITEATSSRLAVALGAARDRAGKIDLLNPKAVIRNYLAPILKILGNFELRPALAWTGAIFFLVFLFIEGDILTRRLIINYDQDKLKALVPLLIRQAKLEELKKTVTQQERAINDTLGESLSIPPILDKLARIVPNNLLLTGLAIGQVGGQLNRVINIKGIIFQQGLPEGATIGNFMMALGSELRLNQVNLVSLGKNRFGGEDVFAFELTASIAAGEQKEPNLENPAS